jgi:uncharacterized protein with HEPN domain
MRDVQLYLHEIAECIELIERYLTGQTREEFLRDGQLQDSVIRRLELIGEAARQIEDDFRQKHPEIPWRRMAGFRDVLVHGYFGVKLDRVWDVIEKDLPELKKNIQPLLTD